MTISNQIISFKLSGINFTGNSTQLNYTSGVTAGTALASKALILDSNKSATGIENLTANSFTATTLNGVLATNSQPNITSIGNLSNLTVTSNLTLSGHNGTNGLILGSTLVTVSGAQLNYNNITSIGVAQASRTLVLDSSRNINNINNLTTSILTVTTLNLNGTNLTSSSTQLNYNNITTPGTGEASKTLVLDSSRNITNINSLTATTLVGTNLTGLLTTVAQTNITSLGTLTSLTLSGAISGVTNLSLTGTISGGTSISATSLIGTLTTVAQPNITSLGTLSSLTVNAGITTSSLSLTTLTLGGTNITASATEINYLTGVTVGSASASKVLVLNSLSNITNINSLTASTLVATILTGTLSTVAQPNITSLGTLTSLTLSGAITGVTNLSLSGSLSLSGTAITASASEINTLTGVIAGTASASKTLVLDSNKDITGLRNITNTGTTTSSSFITNSAGNSLKHQNGTISLASYVNETVNATAAFWGTLSSHDFILQSGGTGRMYINGTSGNISIAASDTSTYKLSINGSLNATSFYLSGIQVTATAAKLNYIDVNIIGTAQASKALVLDSSSNISGISKLTLSKINIGDTLDSTSYRKICAIDSTTVTGDTNYIMLGKSLSSNDYSALGFYFDSTSANTNYLSLGLNGNLSRFRIWGSTNITIGKTTDTGYALDIGGSLNITSFYINSTQVSSSANELNYLSGITVGNASASKALIVDNSKDISGIRILTTSGTTSGIRATNTTSTGSANILFTSDTYNMEFGTRSSSATNNPNTVYLYYNGAYRMLMNTLGDTSFLSTTASTSPLTGCLTLSGGLGIVKNITIGGTTILSSAWGTSGIQKNSLATIYTDSSTAASGTATNAVITSFGQPTIAASNVTVTTTNAATVYIAGAPVAGTNMTLTNAYALWIASGKTLLGDNTASSSVTTGALVVTGGVGISGSLYSSYVYTGSLILGGTTVTATAAELNYNDISNIGVAEANKVLVVDSNKDITGIRTINLNQNVGRPLTILNSAIGNGNGISFTLGKASAVDQQAEIGFNYSTTTGASYLSLGHYGTPTTFNILSNGRVGIGNISPSYTLDINGTLNISGNIYQNGTILSSSYTTGITEGTATASKALVLDSSLNIAGINNMSLTSTSGNLITLNNSSTTGICNLKFNSNARSWELGSRGSANSPNSAFYLYDNTASAIRLVVDTGGNLGIGATPNSSFKLDVSGNINTNSSIYIGGTSGTRINSGNIGSMGSSDFGLITNNSWRLYVTSGGNIGINTTGPSYALEVNGITKVSSYLLVGTSTDTGRLISALDSSMGNGNSRYITLGKAASVNNQAELVYTHSSDGSNSNYFGIGFYGSSPRMTINASGAATITGTLGINGAPVNWNSCPTRISIDANINNDYFAVYRNTGSLGSNLKGMLFLNSGSSEIGNFTFNNSAVAFNNTSDYRLKKDVIPMVNCLDVITKLKPVKYKWKLDNSYGEGFLAHELQEVYPFAVDGIKDDVYKDGSIKVQTVNYSALIPVLCSSIQELNTKNQNLQNQLNDLKQLVQSLIDK